MSYEQALSSWDRFIDINAIEERGAGQSITEFVRELSAKFKDIVAAAKAAGVRPPFGDLVLAISTFASTWNQNNVFSRIASNNIGNAFFFDAADPKPRQFQKFLKYVNESIWNDAYRPPQTSKDKAVRERIRKFVTQTPLPEYNSVEAQSFVSYLVDQSKSNEIDKLSRDLLLFWGDNIGRHIVKVGRGGGGGSLPARSSTISTRLDQMQWKINVTPEELLMQWGVAHYKPGKTPDQSMTKARRREEGGGERRDQDMLMREALLVRGQKFNPRAFHRPIGRHRV